MYQLTPDSDPVSEAIDELEAATAAMLRSMRRVLTLTAKQARQEPTVRDERLIVPRREAARMLGGISTRTVMRMEDRGELDVVPIGAHRYITVESIERRLATRAERRWQPD